MHEAWSYLRFTVQFSSQTLNLRFAAAEIKEWKWTFFMFLTDMQLDTN